VCEPDGRCLGLAWLNRDQNDPSSGAIGYLLLAGERGRGLATRATRLLALWAGAAGGISRLRLVTAADNAPSRAVAERAGFRESHRRHRTDPDGRSEELVVYVLDAAPASDD
jgi:RimJ/RimL family protein N-acetyltransferase